MDSTNKTTSNFCSNCGNKLNEGMLFCDKCGMKVGTDKSDLVSFSVNEKSKNGTKKSKPAKRIVLMVVIILAGMCAMLIKGNSKKYITQVKKSHYSKYNSVTYEMAFKLYGKGEKWSYFKSDKHENIVEYETKAEYQGKDAKIVLQFMCQGNKVECVYFGHDGKDGTKNEINLYLESVFASYITKGAKRDLTSLINKNIDRVGMDYCLVSDETFDEDDGIKMLKNGCWNITDADGDGSIDMIAVSAENKYNILGLQYGENYSDISKKISSDYKVSEIEDGGNGITYAKSDDYYLRIKYQNSEITEIVFTKNDPEIIGEESEDDGSLGETSDNSDKDESDASDFWSDSDSDAGSDDAGNNDEDDSDKSSTETKTDDKPDLSAELEYDEHDDYILDSSDSRYVKKSEVSKMSKKKLRLARNEIFARHGYIFDSADLNKYFNDKNWYIPSIKPSEWSDSLLNKYEKKNIALIKKYE